MNNFLVKDLQSDYKAIEEDKQGFYMVIPSELVGLPSLSDADFRTLTALTSFFNQYGETFVSDERLSKSIGKSVSSVSRSISSLKKNGYIVSKVQREGQFISRRIIYPSEVYAKMIRGMGKSEILGIRKSEGDNINTMNINKEYIGELKNISLTEDEQKKLNERFGSDLTNRSIDKLSTYSKLSKYKSHYSAILSWVIKSVLESNPPRVLTQSQMAECEKKWSPIRSKYNYDQGSQKFRLK